MSTNISQYSNGSENIKSIEELRKTGIDKDLMQKIASDRAEIARINEEAKERLPGQFVTLKEDKETRTFLFTTYQKIQCPVKDFKTGQVVPNRTTTKFRFQVYDLTSFDPNNPPMPGIWERPRGDAEQVLFFMEQGINELTVRRNGPRYSQQTTYTIYPANR
jgi:hypothetical protein